MNQLKLVLRNIKHYFKSNLWLALGVTITTAVLTGGLIVGDSVKYSLEQAVHLRLGEITHSITSGERYFTTYLAQQLTNTEIQSASALKLDAVASSSGGKLKLNKVSVWGVNENFSAVSGVDSFINDGTAISENTASRLNISVGDDILLRIKMASLIPANAPFVSDENQTIAYRSTVDRIITAAEMGRLDLHNSQTAPFNIFISLNKLNDLMELDNKANVILISTEKNTAEIELAVQEAYTLKDASLEISEVAVSDEWELRSERVFIDDVVRFSVEDTGLDYTSILTYFTNYFKFGKNETPYSFISTLPNDEIDADEIIINSWLANDLEISVGDSLEMAYYNIGSLRELTEAYKSFLVKDIVEIKGRFNDRSLMPQIPGLSDAESCRDWQTGVPVNLKSIRDKDEAYWYEYRGLPKAFISFSTASSLWGNRYGSVTSFRFSRNELSKPELEQIIREQINPFDLDIQLRAVKLEGLNAATNGTDFSELFIGLSFFILISGILLTILLFRFNLEKRMGEIGTLSALGFSNLKIKKIFLHEGIIVARTGAALGLILAIGYNKLVFWGLNRVWYDIVRTEVLVPKIKITTLLIGFLISLIIALVTIYFSLNKHMKQSTASLQKQALKTVSKRSKNWYKIAACLTGIIGIASIGTALLNGDGSLNAGAFFMAGGLLLISFILYLFLFLIKERKVQIGHFTKWNLIFQNLRLNRTRSIMLIVLLAIGTYLVVSTGLNRKDLYSNANDKKSGTGGFLFWAETTVPILHNLNDSTYRKEQGFSSNFDAVQMRVAEGDEASCLNLNKISNPRILGLDASQLKERFSVLTAVDDVNKEDIWAALKIPMDDCIPAIADQTVIQWSLMKKVGDTLMYQNALGEAVKLRLIAGIGASVFQGNVIIDNQNFLKHFPSSSGTNLFLIEGKEEDSQLINDDFDLLYRDHGIILNRTATRLAEFMSVSNTYLSIFLVLGALGLLIGTLGLAIILQRSLIERKSELALLSSIGFHRKTIFRVLISEYILLLLSGLLIGLVTALISVYPAIQNTIDNVSIGFVVSLIAIILINGIVWIVLLAAIQLRKMKLVAALRED